MSAVSLCLPDSLKERVQRLARLGGTSMNQYITLAMAEKAALDEAAFNEARREQLAYLQVRAARAPENGWAVIEKLLEKAPDVEPPQEDRFPK